MVNGITTANWRAFQESLARILQLDITVVDPDGRLVDLHHAPGSAFFELDRCPPLAHAYREFFRSIHRLDRPAEEVRVLRDPLDLLVAVVPLDDGWFLVLVGGLDKREPDCQADFVTRLKAYGVRETDMIWSLIPSLSASELREKAANVQNLYRQLLHSFKETSELGQRMILLAAVDEINKLMLGLLGSEQFNLRCILDLVTSSLIILSDAEGAWAFGHHRDSAAATACRGLRASFLQELRRDWEAAASRQQNPVETVDRWAKIMADTAPGLKLRTFSFRRNQYAASLGVVNPETGQAEAALSALGNQVVIAIEVASLYECAQKRIVTLFNSIRHGLLIVDSEGRIMMFNHAAGEIFATQGVNLQIGQPLDEHGLSRSMKMSVLGAAATGETYFEKQATLGQGDSAFYLDCDIAPLRRDDGVIAGAVLIFEDITEKVYLRRRMQDWEKLATAGEVAAGLAHEIRNPLAAVAGAIQLFDMIKDEPKRQEILAKLRVELGRMNKILTNFLRFARPSDKEDLQSTNLAHVIDDLRFLLRSEANLHDVELVIQPAPEDFPMVTGDADSLKQVFVNIAKNAIEAMDENGRLEISLHRDKKQAWVSFHDNGPGIAKENLQNVWRPFFTTKEGGTGLGLWISSTIVQRMGGELRVESELGQGTTVHVILPVKSVDHEQTGRVHS